MRTNISIVFFVFTLLLCSCSKDSHNGKVNIELNEQQRAVLAAGNDFANKLLLEISEKNENTVIAPFGIQSVMTMLANGAEASAQNEILEKMGLSGCSMNDLNEFNNLIYNGLQHGSRNSSSKLFLKNALWVNEGKPVNKQFLDAMKEYYDTDVNSIDFSNLAFATKEINKWIGMPENAGMQIPISALTKFVVTDLFTFNEKWEESFNLAGTVQRKFTSEDGTENKVTVMSGKRMQMYTETDDYQLTELVYKNGSFSMMVLLPKEGKQLDDVISSVSWNDSKMRRFSVDFQIPKFSITTAVDVAKTLDEMGFEKIFKEKSLQGIMDDASLNFFLQGTEVEINEDGTEIKTVTSAGDNVWCIEIEQASMKVDRPFAFAIRENSTGILLLIGKIVRL